MSTAGYEHFPIPLYVSEAGRLVAWPKRGPSTEKVLVVSPPKTGTYFIGMILEALGYCSTGLHLMSGSVTDYRFASRAYMRDNPEALTHSTSFDRILPLVLPGQFLLSHLDGGATYRAPCAGFRIVMPVREFRTTFISHMRFFLDTARKIEGKDRWSEIEPGPRRTIAALRDFGETHISMCRAVLEWASAPNVYVVRFEDLWEDNGEAAQRAAVVGLAKHVGADSGVNPLEALKKSLGAGSSTWSGKRTVFDDWWNEDVEKEFRSAGGQELNERMGYPADWRRVGLTARLQDHKKLFDDAQRKVHAINDSMAKVRERLEALGVVA